MPALAWHLEEPRVGQSYPELLRGAAGEQVREGRAVRRRRRRALRRLSLALLPRGRERRLRALRRQVLRLSGSAWSPIHDRDRLCARSGQTSSDVWTRDIFRDVFPTHATHSSAPRTTSTTPSISRPRPSCTGCWSSRTSSPWRTVSRRACPSSTTTSSSSRCAARSSLKLGNLAEVVRLNENEPGPKTERYFQRTRDGKLLLRKAMERHIPERHRERREAGILRARRELVPGREHRLRPRALMRRDARIYEYLDRDAVRALVDEHSRAGENRRLLIWSLLAFETVVPRRSSADTVD